jgi:formylglycine-generating enzyme required for sulfatase activity
MKTKNILRIVLCSPGDVAPERRAMEKVVDDLNHGVAKDRNIQVEVTQWEKDAHPGFHADGPQGLIDPALNIPDCEIVLGIFWKRFGTPTKDARSGTEHEIRAALTSWKKSGRPQVMIYFKQAKPDLKSPEDHEQYALVLRFKAEFPAQGLYWTFQGTHDFERKVLSHLTQHILEHYPHAKAGLATTPSGDGKQELIRHHCRNLREQFSNIYLLGESRQPAAGDPPASSPMADIERGFVALHLREWQNEISQAEKPALNIEDLFFNEEPPRHFLLRGLPGSGKTTLLRHLAHRYAAQTAAGSTASIPVYLRGKAIDLSEFTLEDLIRQRLNADSDSPQIFDALCAKERFLERGMVLLIDGLDEIEHPETGKSIAAALVKLAKQNPRCKIIVASRPIGLRQDDFPGFRHLDVLPLMPEMIQEYMNKWFAREPAKIKALEQTLDQKPRIRELAENPFLLSMICYTYGQDGDTGLIERRSELYKNCTEALLKRAYDRESDASAKIDYQNTLALIKDLSLRFFLWQESDFPVDHVNIIGQRVLLPEALGMTEDVLDKVQRTTGLIQRDMQGFRFVHRSLWEYFTAQALNDKKVDMVIHHAGDPAWEEVVRLYAGLQDEDEKVATLINGLWTINRPLALRVTTEVKTPAAELIKPLVQQEEGNQGRILLIDSLQQSLPLVADPDRPKLVDETLRILLIDCAEKDCEVIYHAQELLEKLGLRPLEPEGLIYELFDLEHAAKRQRQYLDDSANYFQWIDVKGDVFWMGDDEHQDNEKPAHRVKVDSFRMAKHPVTNRLLSNFPFGEKFPSYGGESHPAIGNTWWEAYYFALWIGGRLPTEAEWEYAARGGKHAQRTQYYFGDDVSELSNHAWFGESEKPFAHAVDEVNPATGKENLNPLGLANMLGNVWEWCEDWSASYPDPKNKDDVIENPRGPKTGQYKIRRGGGFATAFDALRCARRSDGNPINRNYVNGFRVVCGASRF